VIPVLTARAMQAELMESAARSLVNGLSARFPGWRRVVVVCGPGNNGGDGLAAARLLAGRGVAASVFTLKDPAAYRGDPAENARRARAHGLELFALSARGGRKALADALGGADGVVDALFGTGLSRAVTGPAAAAIEAVNASGRPVVAADLPSGLSADTGARLGVCVQADLTVAFAAPKLCHVFFPARQFCGTVVVADIGIPRSALARVAGKLSLVEAADVRRLLPPRRLDAHKADFGRLAVIAGSRGKAGAAVLCARAALRAGAGLVTVFCPESIESVVVSALPEAMTLGLEEKRGALSGRSGRVILEALGGFDAAVIGPGLGTSSGTVAVIEELARKTQIPLVADADFLNAFAGRPGALSRRPATVLTPHPGEAGRLLALSGRAVQADRAKAAAALARASRAIVVLKGAGTLTAAPGGHLAANPTGTPLLATAGSGDVLAGAIGALLAGGMPPREAAIAAVYLHGAAGELLAERLGDAGLLTAELADALPLARKALCTAG
jgi:hydroxyethylthiazole kinase-like uncharacterized protein yjeF